MSERWMDWDAQIAHLQARLAEAERERDEGDRLRELLRKARPAVESYIRKHSRALRAAMRRKDEFHIDRHETTHALSVRSLDRIDAALKEQP